MLNNPINIRPINIDIKINNNFSTRYITPPQPIEIDESYLKYQNAEKLANDLEIKKESRHFVVVDGTFYFGDFIEALIVKNNYNVLKMTISTLSLNQNNVDSLANLLHGNFVQELNLVISDYFYSHERASLVRYIYEELDIDNKFQLAVAGTHCKLCIIETECGKKIVMHGSCNLRSSSNIEQFMIEENEALYDFNNNFQAKIIEKYKTIKKSLRYDKLWKTINE